MLDCTGALIGGSVVAVIVKGTNGGGFRDLTIPYENFSLPPTILTTTTTTSLIARCATSLRWL